LDRSILTPDEETETERTRRKANKCKVISRFKEKLRRQADDEVQTVGELNGRSADNPGAKHSVAQSEDPK